MRNSRLFGFSVFAILSMALLGVLRPEEAPALSVEALREPVLITSTTTEPEPTTTVVFAAHRTDRAPDDSDLGVTTTTTVPTTTAPEQTSAKTPSNNQSPPTTQPKKASSPTTSPPPAVQAGPNAEFEAQFASKINGLRSSSGLANLKRDGSLDSRARAWAEKMAGNGGLSHSNLGSLLPPWSAAGENVGMGGSVKGVFGALKGSSGHKANMLGDYTHLGVGVWVDSSGTIWTAHVFTR